MKTEALLFFRPRKEVAIALLLMALCVGVNFLADLCRGTWLFYGLYQGVLALGICIFAPLWLTRFWRKEPLSSIGVTGVRWGRAGLIGVLVAAISIAGRLMGMPVVPPAVDTLAYLCAGMAMSSLFEEVFFRGYLQTTFEKSFGVVPALVLSGACFSLYHLGYSFIRANPVELLTLFGVGVFFSLSFRITGSIVTSYVVNLPHAMLTFIADPVYSSDLARFTPTSAVVSLASAAAGLALIVFMGAARSKRAEDSA